MALPTNYKQIAMNMSGSQGSQRIRLSGAGSDRNKDNSGPFIHSSHGNPAFTPQKLGKSSASLESRAPKPPKPPEKPILPYMRYSPKVWDDVKTQNPEMKLWEVGRSIDLQSNEKQEVIDEYESDRVPYLENLTGYYAAPEYNNWTRYKSRCRGTDNDSHEPTPRSSSKNQQDRRIDIQPAEDDEDQDDGYSVKRVAYARFNRNHRLMNEIFSDMAVPDIRTILTTKRVQILRRQVHSLTMHQSKLEMELAQMEEKFEAKKRKLIESSELFQEELKKHYNRNKLLFNCDFSIVSQPELCQKRMRVSEESSANKTPSNVPVKSEPTEEQYTSFPAPNAQPTAPTDATMPSETVPPTEPMETDEEPKPVKEEIPEPPVSVVNIEQPTPIQKISTPPSVEQVIKSEEPTAPTAPIHNVVPEGQTSLPVEHHHPDQPPMLVGQPHHAVPPMHHHLIPPHVGAHPGGMSGHPGLQAHGPYSNYPATSGPPRVPYYSQQYPGHPGQSFPSYAPYPYHQQYVQPTAHYMPPRPSSSPLQYLKNGQQPPIGDGSIPRPHTVGGPCAPSQGVSAPQSPSANPTVDDTKN